MTWVPRTPRVAAAPTTPSAAPLFDYQPSGKTYTGLRIENRPDYGLAFMAGRGDAGAWIPEDVAQPVVVSDVAVDTVLADPPGSMQGRGEACFWFGNTARVDGIYGRNARIGIWTGSACRGTIITNAFIDMRSQPSAVGWYAEHDTDFLVLSRSTILADGNAINAEFWYGGRGSRRLIIEDSTIQSLHGWCVFLDAGTYGCLVRRCTLKGHNGVAHPKNLAESGEPNTIDWSTISTTYLTGVKEWVHDNPIGAAA